MPDSFRKIGLDAEALWWGDDGSCPWTRLALCFSVGIEGDMETIEATAPGIFNPDEIDWLVAEVTDPYTIAVGHNVRGYDLDLLQGVARRRLPDVNTQDTMNDLKTGKAYRNTLKAQCAHYGIQLKQDSPDWRKIIEGDDMEWRKMVEYCENDVICALQLERALDRAGLTVPVRTWSGARQGLAAADPGRAQELRAGPAVLAL
jgi:hypothetical protein